MLTGYRGVILALGLILTGAAPQQKQGVSEQAASQIQPTASPTSDYAPYADYKPDPCYQAKDHDAADLCAQWRAALAAEKAADQSSWGNWISAIAALFSAASVVLVVIALQQTEKSLKASRDANEIAADTAKRQLRAYTKTL